MAEHDDTNLSEDEQAEVAEHAPTAPKVVHAAVSMHGEDELDRPAASLLWSAIAAGIAIMTSVSVSGALHHYLPEARWRDAVVALGYPVGFLMVVLGRMQLFTEQTIVAILPLARHTNMHNFARVARLWSLVFVGNLAGAASIAALAVFGNVQSDEMLDGMLAVSAKLQERSATETLMQAIPAGFIMASVAWIRSAENRAGFSIVLVLTLAISLCGFAHVIAGAAEAFLLLWSGLAATSWVAFGFLLPALIGNVIGGTLMFAFLSHAQVRAEI
ncbi:formate/nitrite transporter family protein [Sphingosinicella sp. BN140058]|uniref:formate/nitrite transporter family protein n=1 Tax=Sphingosinicella sp. BN140058 TaxID=1892855 RepID=UPI001011EB4A|nr:formate/nitrite transporter family protein [Sphingosinicella sp. BN140058]QAY77111.1 formate/nitrite transporter family protein [Sphingosinicella sp. BN140058]